MGFVKIILAVVIFFTFLATCFLLLLSVLTRGKRPPNVLIYALGMATLFTSAMGVFLNDALFVVLISIPLTVMYYLNSEANGRERVGTPR